jgi:uncharacterized GH25 family protein
MEETLMKYSSIIRLFLLTLLSLSATQFSQAHDTWVQTNTNLGRVGDLVHVDLMLGNHGNDHRDFKLASKITLEPCTLEIMTSRGKRYDLKPDVVDTGYAPKEGFWSARFVTGEEGLHCVVHTLDTLHHTTRAIKSSKTYFAAAASLDKAAPDDVTSAPPGCLKPLGHPLELVPMVHPVLPMGPGQPITVKVLYQGQPLADARVTFIPRGRALHAEFDEEYERMTSDDGQASFIPKEGNYYLVVVHHAEPEQAGEGYDRTHYSATMTVYVPQLCPCCGE